MFDNDKIILFDCCWYILINFLKTHFMVDSEYFQPRYRQDEPDSGIGQKGPFCEDIIKDWWNNGGMF